MAKGILITVETIVQAPVDQVWKFWTNPGDILQWNYASDDWHTTKAENDLQPGGKFLSRMEAKDGSFGFDFWGIHDQIIENQFIASTLGDERELTVSFQSLGDQTKIVEVFEAESTNPIELQRAGWQAILDNFKKQIESSK
jgi:uncharacterized protein YndB with AHSA1/START domain